MTDNPATRRSTWRWLITSVAASLPVVLGWLSGFDFDHRCPEAAFIALCVVAFAGFCWTSPSWRN